MKDTSTDDSKIHIDVIKLYFDEFKHRHDMYWKQFFQFAAYIGALLTFPVLYSEKLGVLGYYALGFPILAIILSVFGWWLLASEYERIRMVTKKLESLKGPLYASERIPSTGIKRIYKLNIGLLVTIMYLVVFLSLSISSFCLLWGQLGNKG